MLAKWFQKEGKTADEILELELMESVEAKLEQYKANADAAKSKTVAPADYKLDVPTDGIEMELLPLDGPTMHMLIEAKRAQHAWDANASGRDNKQFHNGG